jgi:hypothetical protein
VLLPYAWGTERTLLVAADLFAFHPWMFEKTGGSVSITTTKFRNGQEEADFRVSKFPMLPQVFLLCVNETHFNALLTERLAKFLQAHPELIPAGWELTSKAVSFNHHSLSEPLRLQELRVMGDGNCQYYVIFIFLLLWRLMEEEAAGSDDDSQATQEFEHQEFEFEHQEFDVEKQRNGQRNEAKCHMAERATLTAELGTAKATITRLEREQASSNPGSLTLDDFLKLQASVSTMFATNAPNNPTTTSNILEGVASIIAASRAPAAPPPGASQESEPIISFDKLERAQRLFSKDRSSDDRQRNRR